MNTLLGNCVRAYTVSAQQKEETNEKNTLPLVSSDNQLGYELRNSSQGNPELINPMIKALGAIGATAALVVYDPLFATISAQMTEILAVDLGGSTDFCPIYSGTLHGTKVFLVHQNRFYHQGFDFSEVFSSIRVCMRIIVCATNGK